MRVCNGSWRHGQKRELRGTLNVEESQAPSGHAAEKIIGQEGPTIASLPSGVLAHIFEGLGPRDLASASCVCRAWRHLVALEAAANLVWRSFYSARWQLSGVPWPEQPSPQRPRLHQTTTDAVAILGSRPDLDASSFSSPSSSLSCSPPEMRWQWAYGSKMLRLRSWSGRYSADQVVGHKSAVRAVRLLPSLNLLATASLDRTVRLWDLAAGMPLACSRPHGGTVRCLALDTSILASGCSDNLVRVWHRRDPGTTALPLYDISSKPYLLRGHTGPVSCLALDEVSPVSGGAGGLRGLDGRGGGVLGGGTIFSGSWDCTVRIWRRSNADGGGYDDDESDDVDGLAICDGDGSDGASGSSDGRGGGGHTSDEGASSGEGGGTAAAACVSAVTRRARRTGSPDAGEAAGWSCAGVLQYGDWVYCCAVRGGNLLVAAGSEVVVTDAATGRAVRRFAGLHDGGTVACLEGCRSGRLLFTASADGLLLAHDLRMKQGSRVLWHHNAAVTGLAFEDPWLASSSADGCIILQDSEQALAGGCGPQRALNASCRALHCPTSQPALSLDLSDQWLAAGTDSGVVRLWDFTGAAAAAERAAEARAARSAAKAARSHAGGRHQHHPPQQQPLPPPPPPPPRHQQQHQQQQHQQQHRPKYAQCWAAPPAAGGSRGSAEAGVMDVAGVLASAERGTARVDGGDGPQQGHPDGGAPEAPKAGGPATSPPSSSQAWLPPPPPQQQQQQQPRGSGPSGASRDSGQQRSAVAAGGAGAVGSAGHRRRRKGSGGGGHPPQPNPFHHYQNQSHNHQLFTQQHLSRVRGSSGQPAFGYVGAAAAGGRQQAAQPPPPLPPR